MTDPIDKRRLTESALFEQVEGEEFAIRRNPLKKQMKVKLSTASYTFLQFHTVIWKWALANHNITKAELGIILYIYPLVTFTSGQFKESQREIGSSGDNHLYNLKKGGWISEWSKSKNKVYYTLSSKANRLISRMHKMYMLEEQIPMSARRNVYGRTKKKSDVAAMNLFKMFNQKVIDNKG